MNISKREQRVLHALAQGGLIMVEHNERNKITQVRCLTRDGMFLADIDLPLIKKLKRRKFIASRKRGVYELTYNGRVAVRAQPDNCG